MRTAYLHIGQFKTGSTSIQRFLTINQDTLKKNGYLYPAFPANFNAFTLRLFECFYQKKNPFTCHEIADKLKEMNGTKLNLIYSSEYLGSFSQHLSQLREAIKFPQYKVVIYLRRADYYFESLYNELVRMYAVTDNDPIEKFIALFNATEADRYFTLEKWSEAFGKENITVMTFDKENNPFNIYESFCDAINLNLTAEYYFPQVRRNPSLPVKLLNLLKEINLKYGVDHKKSYLMKSAITAAYQSNSASIFKSEVSFLAEKQREMIIDAFRLSDEKIAKNYLNRDELFDYAFPKHQDANIDFSQEEAKELIFNTLEYLIDEDIKKTAC